MRRSRELNKIINRNTQWDGEYRIDLNDRDSAIIFFNGRILEGTTHASALRQGLWSRTDIIGDLENSDNTVTFGHRLIDGIIVVSSYDNNYDDIEIHTMKQLRKIGIQNKITIVAIGFEEDVEVITDRG